MRSKAWKPGWYKNKGNSRRYDGGQRKHKKEMEIVLQFGKKKSVFISNVLDNALLEEAIWKT